MSVSNQSNPTLVPYVYIFLPVPSTFTDVMVPWPEIDPECISPPLARATEGIDRQQVDAMLQRQTAKSKFGGNTSADLGRSQDMKSGSGS